jgi:DHA1 family purine base/nucleoside efflux pump-like MFS transporter
MIAWGGVLFYVVSFYKQIYGVSTYFVGIIWSAHTLTNVLGGLLCGKIIPRMGVKLTTSLSSLVIGLSIVLFTNAPNFYLAIGFGLMFPLFGSFWMASSRTLALRQVPDYRGAMMSLNSGAMKLGIALGSAVGGLAINLGGYGMMGYVMGFFSLLAFLTVSFQVLDPLLEPE